MDIKILEIITNSIQDTEIFYTKVLQFECLDKTETSVSFLAGESKLIFKQDDSILNPVYHIAFNIPHNQLNNVMEWAKDRLELLPVTEETLIADFELWNANAVYFYDNNHNLLEFIARHDLKNDADQLFSGQSVNCISEVGLVTTDVTALADQLIRNYRLPVFTKQPKTPQFAVLGDDHGLLILVEKGRNWFPVKISAADYPLKITINESGADQLIHNIEQLV